MLKHLSNNYSNKLASLSSLVYVRYNLCCRWIIHLLGVKTRESKLSHGNTTGKMKKKKTSTLCFE